jgi:hypothetical protein
MADIMVSKHLGYRKFARQGPAGEVMKDEIRPTGRKSFGRPSRRLGPQKKPKG